MKIKKTFLEIGILIAIFCSAISGGAYYVLLQHTTEDDRSTVVIDSVQHETKEVADATELGLGPQAVLFDHFGCYVKTDSSIYVVDKVPQGDSFPLPMDAQEVTGVDSATFKSVAPFGVCFGVDKNNVYQGANRLSWGDPATFSVLWYTKPGPILFFRNGSKIIKYTVAREDIYGGTFSDVVNGDPQTFEEILSGYDFAPWAKDKNNVYCHGDIIVAADPLSTKVVDNWIHLEVKVQGVKKVYDNECEVIG